MLLALLVLAVVLNPVVGVLVVCAAFATVGAIEAAVGRVAAQVRGR